MNTKEDCRYFFRPERKSWVGIGIFFSDGAAKAATRDLFGGEVGRLVVAIGDFAFPVADFDGAAFDTPKTRKVRK